MSVIRLTAPADAAWRVAVFRVIYAVFCLWYVAAADLSELSRIPNEEIVRRGGFLAWIVAGCELLTGATMPPEVWFFRAWETWLVFWIAMLGLGLTSRCATLMLLVGFLVTDAYRTSIAGSGSGHVFLAFYIPMFMWLSPWGDRLSPGLRRAHDTTRPWNYFWPLIGLLLMFCVYMSFSGSQKAIEGTWWTAPERLGPFIYNKKIDTHFISGSPLTPLNGLLIDRRIAVVMSYAVLVFETGSIAVFFWPRMWRTYIAACLLFNCFNGIVLGIAVFEVLPVYVCFLLPIRARQKEELAREPIPGRRWPYVAACLLLAAALHVPMVRFVLSGFHVITDYSIWFITLPIGAACLIAYFVNDIVRGESPFVERRATRS